MARRIVPVILALIIMGTTPLAAQSGGRFGRLGVAFGTPNTVLVYRPSPLDFKIGYDFSEHSQYFFLAGDVRLIDNRQIAGVLHGSFGLGLYGKLYWEGRDEDESNVEFDGGTRVPVALSVLVLNNFLEFFIEVAPGIDFYPRLRFADQPVQVFGGITVQLD